MLPRVAKIMINSADKSIQLWDDQTRNEMMLFKSTDELLDYLRYFLFPEMEEETACGLDTED